MEHFRNFVAIIEPEVVYATMRTLTGLKGRHLTTWRSLAAIVRKGAEGNLIRRGASRE